MKADKLDTTSEVAEWLIELRHKMTIEPGDLLHPNEKIRYVAQTIQKDFDGDVQEWHIDRNKQMTRTIEGINLAIKKIDRTIFKD